MKGISGVGVNICFRYFGSINTHPRMEKGHGPARLCPGGPGPLSGPRVCASAASCHLAAPEFAAQPRQAPAGPPPLTAQWSSRVCHPSLLAGPEPAALLPAGLLRRGSDFGERETQHRGDMGPGCAGPGGAVRGGRGEGQSPQRPLLELRVDPVVERIETHPCDRHSPAPPRAGRGSPPPQNPWDPALEFLTAVRSLENVQEASRVTGSEAAEGAGLWSLRVFAHVCLGGKWPRGRQPGTAPPYVITWGAVGSPALWDRGASESPGLSHLQAAEGR